MPENSFAVLTNQVIGILTSYIPHIQEDEATAATKIGKDAYKQGKELYEIIQTRFTREYSQEILDLIQKDLEVDLCSPDLQSRLTTLLQNDSDFERELRRIVSDPPLIRRNLELQKYGNFLSKDTPWIWIITSLEKNGKTKLLQQMKEKEPRIPVVTLDFAKEQDHLSHLTGEREPFNGIKFLENFASQVKAEDGNLREIEIFLNTLQDTRRSNNKELLDFIINLHTTNGSTQSNLPSNIDGATEAYSQKLEKAALENITNAFFGLMESFEPDNLIIHLDTCEWLMESVNMENRRWLIEDILLKLYRNMRQKGKHVHVIMMSSIGISLPGLDNLDQQESLLGPLDEGAVNEYLQRIGINEPKLLEQFYNMTEGHAYSVFLLRELWQQWEKEGKPLSKLHEERELTPGTEIPLVTFQRAFYEKVDMKFINQCILEKLDKSLLGKSTKFSIILREFDLPKFTMVFSKLLEPDPENVFRQLVKRLYVIEKGSWTYSIRDLLRAALAQRILKEHPKDWEEYHEYAIKFWWNKARNPIELLNTSDWYYHNLAFHLGKGDNEVAGRQYWTETLEGLRKLGVNTPTPLLEAASDKTLMFFTELASEVQNYKVLHREG